MSTEALSYLITSFAPEDIDKKFVTAKKQFELFINQPKTSENNIITRNTAHVTLKQPFYLPDDKEEDLVEALEEIQFSKVQVTASELTVFQTDRFGHVLVTLVDKTPEILALHQALLEVTGSYIRVRSSYEGGSYNPHLSLFYNLPPDRVGEALAYAKEQIVPLAYTLDTFYLLRALPNIKKEREFVKTYRATP